MEHIEGRNPEVSVVRRESTFTGRVWGDQIMPEKDGVSIHSVYFEPTAHTYWHRHEGGQVLHVTVGEGWVAERGGPAVRIRAGDTIWTAPGVEHCHGATDSAILVHLAVSIGKTEWLEEADSPEIEPENAG